jgi:hypothetical protein
LAKQIINVVTAASERDTKAIELYSYLDPGVLSIDTFLTAEEAEDVMSALPSARTAALE